MKRWAIAIGVVVSVGIAIALGFRRAPPRRTEAVVLRDVIARELVRADLYLPARGKEPAPCVVFAQERGGGGASVADAMQRRGIAVALLSYTVAEGWPIRRVGGEIAEVVREIVRRADDLGVAREPVLAGDGAGASLAALIALDGRFGLDTAKLRGVIVMSGVYDPSEDAENSPARYVRAGAPPFLILSAPDDSSKGAEGARAFARALERAGASSVRSYYVSLRDSRSLRDFSGERNDVADLVAAFVRGAPPPGGPESKWAIDDAWGTRAPLSSEPFWADERLVVRRTVDERFRGQVGRIFAETMRDLDPWPKRTYDAIDLSEFLIAHPELGAGDWLEITNARGERIVLHRDDIQRERPVLVIGIDDEKNLFRLFVTYNVYRSYTFRPETEPRPLLVRPVGAFLYFPHAGPRIATFADFALTPASFHVVGKDPLAAISILPKTLVRTLTGEQGCLQCHSLHGAGARAHHLRADDGRPTGGLALAFEEYPREVLRRFLFEQDEIANIFGVRPIRVDKAIAAQLLDEIWRIRPAPDGAQRPARGPI